jgi:hypothetical protein
MSDELSPEDRLRLEVLLAQDVQAIRIDEGRMILHALTSQGEASIPLVPNARPDKYLRLVRELLSGHALGSPGGYPVFLSRWTRHGQMEGMNLGKLLLTGEPEAVVAVVYSPALTDELAERVWWIEPNIDNARLMLRREAVARGRMGSLLAAFLIEHLAFLQDDHLAIMDTVAVLLHSGVLSGEQVDSVWRKCRRNNSYYVAFLEMAGGRLPNPLPAHPRWSALGAGQDEACSLARALSAQGQTFLATVAEVLERPETQEVVTRSLNALGGYFTGTATVPDDSALAERQAAVLRLAASSEESVKAIFARSSAIGSLMRRKIEPVITPLLADIRLLRT